MTKDPIVEEVHRIREKLWDECGRDLGKLLEHCRRVAAQVAPDRLVGPEDMARRLQGAAKPPTQGGR